MQKNVKDNQGKVIQQHTDTYGGNNMKRFKFLVYFLFISTLLSCSRVDNDSSQGSETSSNNDSVIVETNSDYEFVKISEEEQFERSDLVLVVEVTSKGNSELIDGELYTTYYFDICEFIKGTEPLSFAYFRGDTTINTTVYSSIDETLETGKKYKIFFKKYESIYITTAGVQSIVEILDI